MNRTPSTEVVMVFRSLSVCSIGLLQCIISLNGHYMISLMEKHSLVFTLQIIVIGNGPEKWPKSHRFPRERNMPFSGHSLKSLLFWRDDHRLWDGLSTWQTYAFCRTESWSSTKEARVANLGLFTKFCFIFFFGKMHANAVKNTGTFFFAQCEAFFFPGMGWPLTVTLKLSVRNRWWTLSGR